MPDLEKAGLLIELMELEELEPHNTFNGRVTQNLDYARRWIVRDHLRFARECLEDARRALGGNA